MNRQPVTLAGLNAAPNRTSCDWKAMGDELTALTAERDALKASLAEIRQYATDYAQPDRRDLWTRMNYVAHVAALTLEKLERGDLRI